MGECTPTTDEMRNEYVSYMSMETGETFYGDAITATEAVARFNRWLAAIEREAAAKALAEFAVEIERCDMPERGVHINMTQYREGLIDGVSRAMRAASRRAAEIRERKNDE